MKSEAQKLLRAQLAIIADFDRLLQEHFLKTGADPAAISALLEAQLSTWSDIRNSLAEIAGKDHQLLERYDELLFHRYTQLVCFATKVKYLAGPG